MPHHQYACPECGLTRQSAEDLAGKEVKCLGCQAVFVAASMKAASWGKAAEIVARPAVPAPAVASAVVAPPPAPAKAEPPAPAIPPAPPPVVRSSPPPPRRQLPPPIPRPPARQELPPEPEESDEPEPEVYLPPIPRSRRFPVGLAVVGALLVASLAAAGVLIVKYKSGKTEPADRAVAQAPAPDKPAPADPRPKSAPPESTPFVAPPAPKSRGEEEEELSPRPAPDPAGSKKSDRKIGESIIGDIDSILPKSGGAKPADAALPPITTTPTDNPAEKPAPADRSAPADRTKPADLKPDLPSNGDGQIPADLLAKLKAATVFVKLDAGEMKASGSGFVLRVSGDTALIVTNEHVAKPRSKVGVPVNATHEVVFYSGRKNEFSRKAEVLAADPEHDLAVLRVSGVESAKDFPAPINTADQPALTETSTIYVIGFPFGNMLSTGRENPGVTINRGTISSIREDEAGDTAMIQIDSDANPGNSGGPVVDSRGRLVGVLRGGKPGTNLNFAIPQVELTRMLNGRVSNLKFRVGRVIGPNAEMEITGNLVDPLNKVKSSSVRVVRADSMKEKPSAGADGKWEPIAGAEETDLRVKDGLVSGLVKLPVRDRDRGEIEILFQPACTNHDGRTNHFAPVTQTLVIREGGGTDFPGGFGPPPGFPRPPTGPSGLGPGGVGGPPVPPPLPPPPVGGGPGRPPGAGPPPTPPAPVGPGGAGNLPTPPTPPPPPGSGRPGPPGGGGGPPPSSKGGPKSPPPGGRPPGG